MGLWEETPVALKRLKSADYMAEFKREADLLLTLSHPHIVQFHGIYIDEEGDQYIVTEYLKRGSLRETLKIEGDSLKQADLLYM